MWLATCLDHNVVVPHLLEQTVADQTIAASQKYLLAFTFRSRCFNFLHVVLFDLLNLGRALGWLCLFIICKFLRQSRHK